MKTPLTGLLLLTLAQAAGAATTEVAPAPAWKPAQTLSVPPVNAPQHVPVTTTPEPTTSLPEDGSPPLPLPALDYAQKQMAPLSPREVDSLRNTFDQLQRSESRSPVTAVPRVSSLTVNLSPGASLPMLRALPNFPSSVSFTDETGAPWPIAAPPLNGNNAGFEVNYIPDSPAMSVQARRAYDTGSVTVYLKGLPVPVVIALTSGEPDNAGRAQITDSSLNLRIPLRGPSAKALPIAREKISLDNPTLQAFLDGVPPDGARHLKTGGGVPLTAVWQMGDDLYIRSRSELRDAFVETSSAADGTHVWKLPLTPEVVFSVQGRNTPLTINLE
ncbi:TPA: conjugal transfer protein TraN [Serratia marcescens]|uniref:DotH/IcmK family type IV secretion protein n=1 Tax=Serratia marcescens TaxID=615 RepID=UPI0018D79AB0|nr:conjugal transfer protein TraN [Serratia marcescens]HEJ7047471.1 conjugal transfer protein TraN [Serratia marcescens]HEJ9022542.1 conjugal transfer protein TraN [Serratia marcescens]HEJ9028272.1 conjugal transfer protein TraN [Serratia marcescens]HEJ9043998.1 conjugal transfer protein TraN [Serratia marcescens]